VEISVAAVPRVPLCASKLGHVSFISRNE